MKRKIIWTLVNCLMVLSLVVASCGPAEEEEEVVAEEEEKEEEEVVEEEEEVVEEEEEELLPPDVPKYGGTMVCRLITDPTSFDPYISGDGYSYLEGVTHSASTVIPREIWDPDKEFESVEYMTGELAESWELEDWQTITLHIRKGVHWWDKPPVNGRELTAYDIEYSWHRLFGLGSGFTEPSNHVSVALFGPPESVTATDKYTVVCKLPAPSMSAFRILLSHGYALIVPREVIEEYGELSLGKWKCIVGTGPFILEDFVSKSSLTYIKNPNYWGYDEYYPENRLPYLDGVKELIVADSSTALAGLRVGKIDWLGGFTALTWEQAEMLKKENPNLREEYTASSDETIVMRVDLAPFSDIKVRKALNMAIDRKTIAATYYGGYVDGTPIGQVYWKGYRTEYDDWPQEVKDGYTYNPEGAKKLLAEAGYPDGFKCTLTTSSKKDLDIIQVVQNYLAGIDVDMEIQIFEHAAYLSYILAGNAEMCSARSRAYRAMAPPDRLMQLTSAHKEYATHGIKDPYYEQLESKISGSVDTEEQKRLCREADLYAISQYWQITVQPIPMFNLIHPWIKPSYPSKASLSAHIWARTWIDQALKKSLGY